MVPPPFLTLRGKGWSGLEGAQRAGRVGELSGVEDLDSGVVLPVEGGRVARVPGLDGVGRRVEPDADVEGVDRAERRVARVVRRGRGVHRRGGGRLRSDGERLLLEPADVLLVGNAVAVGLEVALVPRHPERCVGDLDDERVELGVGRQTTRGDAHPLDGAVVLDGDPGRRVGQTARGDDARGALEREVEPAATGVGRGGLGDTQAGGGERHGAGGDGELVHERCPVLWWTGSVRPGGWVDDTAASGRGRWVTPWPSPYGVGTTPGAGPATAARFSRTHANTRAASPGVIRLCGGAVMWATRRKARASFGSSTAAYRRAVR